MIWSLRLAFTAVLIALRSVTGWASAILPLWQTPQSLLLHPWFIAIAMSAYMLLSLWRLPADAPIQRLLLRHEA
jgi:hypothetical protein